MARSTRSARSVRIALAALAVALAAIAALSACGPQTSSDKPSSTGTDAANDASVFPVTVTDDASRTVTIEKKPARIVSLAPANTEILFAIGLGDRVVGVTTYCDYPPEAAGKPKVGDFVSPNLEAVAAAQPDLVLATGGVQAEVIGKLEDLGAQVVVLDPQSVDGVRTAIKTTGLITGESEKALEVDKKLAADIEDVVGAAPDGAVPLSTFIEIGQNPLFTAGSSTLLGDMVRVAYGANVVADAGYVAYSLEQLVQQDPEVYLATKGSMSDPSDLSKRPGYSQLSSVKNGRVYVLDDNLVTRPGPRVGEGLKSIAEALHPDWFEK